MPLSCDVSRLFATNSEQLELLWVAGQSGGDRILNETGSLSADLIGHLNLIHPGRIQVLGYQEIEYLHSLPPKRLNRQLDELMNGRPPAIIVAENHVAPFHLRELCDQIEIPLFLTPLDAAQVIEVLRIYLSKTLAPCTLKHGVFMDVLGLGVLIAGESGLGKSELGLELISRGHGLVADDAIEFSRIAPNIIEGRCPPILQNLLEVRGLGLLDIKAIFGETAVRRKMRLRLIVQLIKRSAITDEFQRLPLDAQTEEILGLAIRKVVVPVAAGRNLAVLVEAAVRNTVLQLRGIDTVADFIERQRRAMKTDELLPPEPGK